MPKEQYMCQLCANHGIFNQPKKGHKQKCPHKSCSCGLCALNTKRRALDQIERHLKNNNSNDKESSLDHEEEKPQINSSDPMRLASLQHPCYNPTTFTVDVQHSTTSSVNAFLPIPIIDLAGMNNYSLMKCDRSYQSSTSSKRSIFHSAEDLAR